MSTCKFLSALVLMTAVMFVVGTAFAGPNLGRDVKPEEIAAWDISIPPNGSGLPPGGGTATEGDADPLAGGIGTLASQKPVKTIGSYWPYATTLFDYVRRAMPFNAPQSLSNDEVYAVSAYLLSLNGIIAPEARIDAKKLPQVKMPNRDGFVSYWP